MRRPNVLLVSIEDLNDYVEPLGGHPQVKTPNISRLAARGALFTNAFAPAPACSPARTAALFGVPPWRSGVYGNDQVWHDAFAPGRDLSLIGHLREAGFETFGAGKIFYGGVADAEWTAFFKEPNDPPFGVSRLHETFAPKAKMMDYGPAPVPGPLYDERNVARLMETMEAGAEGRVWALGLYRPHLPFIAPQRFFDLYPERVLAAPALKRRPYNPFDSAETEGLPAEPMESVVGGNRFGRRLHEIDDYAAFLRAYLASISYADHLLGFVLDRLEALGLERTTHVVLWSDHGYHFGEKHHFHKYSLWERSLRTPMIIAGPGLAPGRFPAPVPNGAFGPTLCDLMHVDAPRFPRSGSLLPVIRGEAPESEAPVISVFAAPPAPGETEPRLAWTARSARHRLIRYWNGGLELYDHERDPFEHRNLARAGLFGGAPRRLGSVIDALGAALPGDPAPAARPGGARLAHPEERALYPHWARSVEPAREAGLSPAPAGAASPRSP